jgi:type I restriction enzyme M protein
VEAIVILPRSMFYTTDISVTLWILNKNKSERTVKMPDTIRNYRNRKQEVLFMDLRETGIPFEKKYTQFSEEDIATITSTFHLWQSFDGQPLGLPRQYKNVPEFCFSASLEDLVKKDYSLVPSKYIEFVNRDENIDYATKMKTLQEEMTDLLKAESQSKTDLLTVFSELGYEIKL